VSDLILTSNMYERLWEGVQVTLQVLAYSFVLGIVLSLLFGVARLSHRTWMRGVALVYVEFSRGISSIVLLFWMAIALPILLGVSQSDLILLASIALGINMGGYGAEIIRGAIQSVPKGQTEATIALNLTNTQRLRHVVLPQAMRVILPPMGNLTIEILKGTALVSLVGVSDLTFEIDKLNTNQALSANPVSTPVLFINGLVIYFVLAQIINVAFRLLERRANRRFEGRRPTLVTDEGALTAGAT
jgi:polar amino acid transport system permease protein